MVVGFHAGIPIPGGFVGVDVFFVISGFVITAMLIREVDSHGKIRLGRFYVRRFKRLIPALAVVVGVVAVASLLFQSPLGNQESTAITGIGAMLFAANMVIARTTGGYFDGPAELNPLLHTWSLSVEEQFYLVFPAVLIFGLLIARSGRYRNLIFGIVIAFMGAISLGLTLAIAADLSVPLPDSLIGFYGPATRVWEFAAGALLAVGGSKLAAKRQPAALVLAVAGSSLLLASLWLIDSTTPFPGPWTILPVAGTVLLIAAGTARTPIGNFLESRAMVATGDRSYSIYLWHWPFIVFAHILWSPSPLVLTTAALVSIIPAWASYKWIEQPIRLLQVERGRPLAKLIAVVLAPPIFLSVALLVSANNYTWNATLQHHAKVLGELYIGETAGCGDETGWKTPEACTWNSRSKGKPIYLVGDSNALHFSDGIEVAARELSRPMRMLAKGGCSYLPREDPYRVPNWEGACAEFNSGVQEFLKTAEPGTVVISNASWLYLYANEREGLFETDEGAVDSEHKLAAFSASMTGAVTDLKTAGHRVILAQSIPHWGNKSALSWESCTAIVAQMRGCEREMAISDVPEGHQKVAQELARIGDKTDTLVLNLEANVCPNETCQTVRKDGTLPYRDGTHVTAAQSRALAPIFERVLRELG